MRQVAVGRPLLRRGAFTVARTRGNAHRRGSSPAPAERRWRRDAELYTGKTGDIKLAVRERRAGGGEAGEAQWQEWRCV